MLIIDQNKFKDFHNDKFKDLILSKVTNLDHEIIFFEEKRKTSYIDVFKRYYFWNDVHFNAEGNKVIAERLIKEF